MKNKKPWHQDRNKYLGRITAWEKFTWYVFAMVATMLCLGILMKACAGWGGL